MTTAGKNIQHLKNVAKYFEGLEFGELDRSFGSSNIEVLDGSFGDIKPIQEDMAHPHQNHTGDGEGTLHPSTSKDPLLIASPVLSHPNQNYPGDVEGTRYPHNRPSTSKGPLLSSSPVTVYAKGPLCTSTPVPVYETISDEDTEMDITQNLIEQGRETGEQYIADIVTFLSKTCDMVKGKKKQRVKLVKRLNKYKEKIKNLEKAIMDIDFYITFGDKVPKLVSGFNQ